MYDMLLFQLSYFVLWGLVLFQTLVLLEVVRRVSSGQGVGTIGDSSLVASNLLESGSPAPAFSASEIRNGQVVVSESFWERPTLLVFVAPDCAACRGIGKELEEISWRDEVHIVALCQGNADHCARWSLENLPEINVLFDEGGKIAEAFRVRGTPTAVLVDEAWNIWRYGTPGSAHRLGLAVWDVQRPGEGTPAFNRNKEAAKI